MTAAGGTRYAFFFLVLLAGCLRESLSADASIARLAWALVALSPGVLTLAYIANRPDLLGKRDSGKIALIARVALAPYFLSSDVLLRLSRLSGVVQGPSEITPRLWVGPRLTSSDRGRVPPFLGVIDMTAEFQETGFLRAYPSYFCMATLDGTAPSVDQMRRALECGARSAESGIVYVHCASGHSRSVAVAAGILVFQGIARSPGAAVELIRAKRPRANPTREQSRALEQALGLV